MKIYLYENQHGKVLSPAIVPYKGETPKYVVDAYNLIEVLSRLQKDGMDLTNLDLSQRTIHSSEPATASWRTLNGASLKNINLSKCNLSYNTISDMDMSGANFSHCIMNGTTIINSFGSNVNFYCSRGEGVKFSNTILIEPDFRYGVFPGSEWSQSKWCLQKNQIGSVLDKTLLLKQNYYGVNEQCEGLKMSISKSYDAVIPKFVPLTRHHEQHKNILHTVKNSNDAMKMSIAITTPTLSSIGFLYANSVKTGLSKMAELSSHILDGGLLSSISHLISSNPLLSMGIGLGTAMSISLGQNKKNSETQISDLAQKTYNDLQLKYKKLPNMSEGFFAKFNHLIFSSNRNLTKTIADGLKKVTPRNEASCLIKEYKTGQVIFCNKKNLDLAMNEIMDKIRDNTVTYKKSATFIIENMSNDKKSITFSPDGTTIVVSMNQNNEPVTTDVFDQKGSCIQSIDNQKNTTSKVSQKTLNDMLQNIVVNMEYMKKAEQTLKINYNPLTHFLERKDNFIKIIDRKTMMVDNPYDFSALKILPNQQVECITTNQGNITQKTICSIDDLTNRNMPDKKRKDTFNIEQKQERTYSQAMFSMA